MNQNVDLGDLIVDMYRMCNQDKPFLVKMMAHLDKSFFLSSKIFSKVFLIYKLYFERYQKAPTEKVIRHELIKVGEDKNIVDGIAKEIFSNKIFNHGEKDYITDLVVMHARKINVEKAIMLANDKINDGDEFTDDKFKEILANITESIKFSIDTDLGIDLYDIDERYNRIANSLGNKISTGFTNLDHVTGGGLARKELAAVQGPPGLGKCTFYGSEVDIEIDTEDPLYEKLKHLFIKDKKSKIKSKIKIGDLVEALGAAEMGDDVVISSTLKVNSPFGYKSIESVHKTYLNPEWEIETENGKKTIVADKHRLETQQGWLDKVNGKKWSFVEDLKIGDEVYTEDGWEKLTKCFHNNKRSAMYDLQVADNHSYYADKFHGHNTIFLVNLGFKFLVSGYNVAHYSLEMGEERLGLRYDGVASGQTINSLMKLEGIDEVKKAYKMLKMMTKTHLKMKEFPTGAASAYDIEAHLDELALYEDFEPDVIVVDYGDIMKSTRNTKNTYEEQGWIFRELRALAIKRNCVVLTATQSRRDALKEDGGTKDIIGMDQVADSMEKNRILDLLLSVQQSREERDEGRVSLWVAKNRNGAANIKLNYLINYRNMKLSEPQVTTNV